MNRRTFLTMAAGFGAAAWLGRGGNVAAGSAVSFGLQLYTVRRPLQADAEATLRRVAATGVKEVEFAGYFDNAPQKLKQILDSAGLSAPSAHIDLATLRDRLLKAIDAAGVLGHKYLVLGYLQPAERGSLDDYKRLAELLNAGGEKCRAAGITLGYHNHDFEFARLDGRVPLELLLETTDMRLVTFEMDLYWITKAGFDPLDYFKRHRGRFSLVHVKDMDNTPAKSFTEAGRGVIDFKAILPVAKKSGVKHFFVEQDTTPGDPFESINVSLKYLRGLKI